MMNLYIKIEMHTFKREDGAQHFNMDNATLTVLSLGCVLSQVWYLLCSTCLQKLDHNFTPTKDVKEDPEFKNGVILWLGSFKVIGNVIVW